MGGGVYCHLLPSHMKSQFSNTLLHIEKSKATTLDPIYREISDSPTVSNTVSCFPEGLHYQIGRLDFRPSYKPLRFHKWTRL